MVQDIDDKTWFKVKKVQGGKRRLVPHFQGPIPWNSAKGFEAVRLLLSCLGAEGEYVLWDDVAGKEMDVEGWRGRKFGAFSKPPVRHSTCDEVVTSTRVNHLQQGQGIGCGCNWNMAKHWRHRRWEVVQWGKERGFEVVTTEVDWEDKCVGVYYCPKLRCVECDEVVTSTTVNHLQQGQGIGCSCRKKTEAKLRAWLERRFPDATVRSQYRGPKTECNGQTHFDFFLTFRDDFAVLMELDGPQHFGVDKYHFCMEGCERDLLKEEWAIAKGLSVVRVLQEDVWDDKLGWDSHVVRSIEAARWEEPTVYTPPYAPEYLTGVYAELRP